MQEIHSSYNYLSDQQRKIVLQRLTALWAFAECGLGGTLHALQIPFTGLIVGGLAIFMISFIAKISENSFRQIFQSLVIVLIVKMAISPHTPFPAYIAVTFQALMGFIIYRLFRINFFSIVLLAIITMIESAIQKLLILTLFFGQSLWEAVDNFIKFISQQTGLVISNGSFWIIAIYLSIYVIGGICVAWISFRVLRHFFSENNITLSSTEYNIFLSKEVIKSKKRHQKLLLWLLILILTTVSLFLFSLPKIFIVKTIIWSITAILVWYTIFNPLIIKGIQSLLRKKQGKYTDEVFQIISFLPVIKSLTIQAWQKSADYKGSKRWQYFTIILLQWSLTYAEAPVKPPLILRQLAEEN